MPFHRILLCLLLLITLAGAQDATPTTSADAPKPEQTTVQEHPLTYHPEKTPAPEVFKQSEAAQKFKFGKTELELYKQIEAFDKYIED
ncbi:MAG TPA: hypothetical protein VFP40_20570, partial [Terriglobales bacterium]|nr:hypothetical protein [Terriglobales bacterium]